MNKRIVNALLDMYEAMEDAALRQIERGEKDKGQRSKVTSGKHLNALAQVIRDDLLAA